MGPIVTAIFHAIKKLVEMYRERHGHSWDAPMTREETNKVLAEVAEAHAEKGLAWQTSIVDLLKLLGKDSSLEGRKALAAEIGYAGVIDGSAQSNLALHAEVMKQVAEHDIKVPDGRG
jgi:Domain of unknown function (DUF3597)